MSIRLCQKGYQFKCIMYHCCKCIAGVEDYMKVVHLKLPYCRMLGVSSNYNIDLLKTRWSVSKIDQKHFTIFTIWTISAFQIYFIIIWAIMGGDMICFKSHSVSECDSSDHFVSAIVIDGKFITFSTYFSNHCRIYFKFCMYISWMWKWGCHPYFWLIDL